jgi:2-C-methyl-D-erythritol 4-phosphate cytidylyltransferase/2-C-methyl-D-erythritol 2,4-cyclodiphosphate synthase
VGSRAAARPDDWEENLTMSSSDPLLVVVAAGASSRFGGDKLSASLGDRTVLERSVDALRSVFPAAPTVLVVAPHRVEELAASWSARGVTVVAGGARRQESVRLGVEAASPAGEAVVLIHDAARPFVPEEDILAVAEAARRDGAALLVAPLSDTLKRVSEEGLVAATVSREGVARALTPQGFRADVLRRAWARAGEGVWTDEAALVEAAGLPVRAVPGDPRNVKVTTPGDLEALRAVFPRAVRVGQGFDVHPFAADRPLWLCGVRLEGEAGLAGHSDADVVLHAVTDAILGACAAGDIGIHFPPSDTRWRDAASEVFVRRAIALAAERGFRLVHCDVTVLAERPRLTPHRPRLLERLAAIVELPVEEVGLKATTCEGLGFVGRGEGIAASALVTLER